MNTPDIKRTQRRASRARVSDKSFPKFAEFMTTRKTRKLWITPENHIIPLSAWHFEYFRDPKISTKYGVIFRDEENTRLDALRVGFVRINYEVNGGRLTIETMRWDRALRELTNSLILANADAIDVAHLHLINKAGQAVQLGCVPLMERRQYGLPINRRSLATWNNLRATKL